jgi:hypothetical protein
MGITSRRELAGQRTSGDPSPRADLECGDSSPLLELLDHGTQRQQHKSNHRDVPAGVKMFNIYYLMITLPGRFDKPAFAI